MGEYVYALRKSGGKTIIDASGAATEIGLLKYWYKPWLSPSWEPDSFSAQIRREEGRLAKTWEKGTPKYAVLVGPNGIEDGNSVYAIPVGATSFSDYSHWFEETGKVGTVRIVGKKLFLETAEPLPVEFNTK